MERVQKVISNSGYTSRRKAEELIKNNMVYINDKLDKSKEILIKINDKLAKLGDKVSSLDTIKINGEIINRNNGNYVYYLLNKPRGVITSNYDPEGRKVVTDLIDTERRIYPVGRLDYDTTGVLLLTDDGKLTNLLLHPSKKIEKTYLAKIEGIIPGSDIIKLKNGVMIDDFKTSPARVKLKSYNRINGTSLVEITIHEGHNHQVKKMFESIGYTVSKLTRIRFAGLDAKSLKSGEYRLLSVKEVQRLYSLGK